MANHENWRLVDCPTCPALAGFACFMTGKDWGCVHAERLRAGESFRPSKVSLPGTYGDPKIKAHQRKYWSANCQHGSPERCNGKRRIKNGRGFALCENPAHRDLSNLAQQASED
jgi:hypothetical protein